MVVDEKWYWTFYTQKETIWIRSLEGTVTSDLGHDRLQNCFWSKETPSNFIVNVTVGIGMNYVPWYLVSLELDTIETVLFWTTFQETKVLIYVQTGNWP